MGNWRKVCTVLTILLLAVVILLSGYGSPFTRIQMERQVKAYLQELGYTEQDLSDLQAVYNKDEQNKYLVKVIFADTSEQAHYYYYDKDGEIQELERLDGAHSQ